jgi:hypothetical protein
MADWKSMFQMFFQDFVFLLFEEIFEAAIMHNVCLCISLQI